ncbi:AzlC protein [Pseudovibrio sp. Ad5]|uniref:AzlC family ABC transporter permease n=1 Tax=Pseudovibrio sp. Ad5 TaxID=989436 RepID=UPI0007AE8C1B|nr:AzlC family ABC transporter permease [Pseudovibrio sp. Ad5]KZK98295.1 AzlC protein [Pseudovibrio sp. Ad5]
MTSSDMDIDEGEDPSEFEGGAYWFRQGAKGAFCLPTLILMMAFVGFTSLAREVGLTLTEVLLMSLFMWALPSIVVLTGAMSAGAGLIPAAIAVALSAVRLMPMTVALMPVLRDEKRTKTWHMLIVSHFVAVTAWVFAMRNLPSMPRAARLPFFAGFGSTVHFVVLCSTALSYIVLPAVEGPIAAGLVLLTPIYFMFSMYQASRTSGDRAALILGLVLGPVFYHFFPGADLLLTGFVGGTIAFAGWLFATRRAEL